MPQTFLHQFAPDFFKPAYDNERNFTDAFQFEPNQNIPKGSPLGIVTASGKLKVRNGAASDGSQTAVGFAKYDMQVDANGKITLSSTSGQSGGFSYEKLDHAEIWLGGAFNTAQIPGWTAAIAGEVNGRVVAGVLIF
jgi:hypothetical protein